MNDLNELNTALFDTLRGVIDKKIDGKTAQTVVNISKAIVDNAKVQVEAATLFKNSVVHSEFLGILQAPKLPNKSGDLFDQKLDFAKSLGYKNISEAIGKMGQKGFENAFDDSLKMQDSKK